MRGARPSTLDLVLSHPLPDDLLDLQRALLAAEAHWRAQVLALYAHPVMLRARADGRHEDLAAALRREVRAAA